MKKEKLGIKHASLIMVIIFIFALMIAAIKDDSNTSNYSTPANTIKPQVNSIYKTEEKDLKIIIGSIPDPDFGTLEIEILDIRYALFRLIDIPTPIYDLPFYAMKDSKSNSFIGIIVGQTGKAIFLVSPEALNQTKKSDLEKSIKAINGTAKTYNQNLQLAGSEYNPIDYLSL